MFRQASKVVPRNGHTLLVGIGARISGCQNQREMSLDDQVDHAKEAIREFYDGPVEFDTITTVAKGESLDRPELERIEIAYRSKQYDFFIFDDLSRLIRGGEAARLLGVGVDHGTRTLCLGDGIDTADSTWEEDALNACSENVAHNERTSKRIKRKTMNRFKKYGGPTGRPIAGYIMPEGAKTYPEWSKNDDLTPIIQQGKDLLLETLDCAIVADLFNEQGFPMGPYARRDNWDGPGVRKYYGNPLLKGMPCRGKKHSVKRHGSGRRKSVTNPNGPTYFPVPHLAHLTEEDFDQLNALLDAENAHHCRPTVNGVDPLLNRSRRHSVFPGVHSRCWYCGSHHVWGGNGITENLMCQNSRQWQCWHSTGFSGPMFTQKLVASITEQFYLLDNFDEQFSAMVEIAHRELHGSANAEWTQLLAEENVLSREKGNLLAGIKALGPQPMLIQEFNALEARGQALLLRRHSLERRRRSGPVLPASPVALRSELQAEIQRLATSSPEFSQLMRRLVPEIFVYAVRLCDGGPLYPRAKVTLKLAGTYPDLNLVPGCHGALIQSLTIDLFDPPPRERIRAEVVRLAATGMQGAAIASTIPERPTVRMVEKALALQQEMESRRLASPYVMLLDPPEDYRKVRRHRHPRYLFKPLAGYERPQL